MAQRLLPFFLILLLLPAAHAVGFMSPPAQREFLFTPGEHISIPLHVINGEHIEVTATTMVEGDPSTIGTPDDNNIMAHVTLDDPAPKTGPREVVLNFDLPQAMRPGPYDVYVTVADYPANMGSAAVSAIAMTRMRFTIRVLTDEPYAEITGLQFQPIAEGLPANVTVLVTSRTKQDISSAKAAVLVQKDGVTLASGTSAPQRLPSGGTVGLVAIVPTEELTGGEYTINATVTYDGRTTPAAIDTLKIGTLHVGVPAYSRELTYNVTNRFTFNISNQWNKGLQEVYGVVQIGGQSKKTASQDIPPFGQTAYEAYFDRDEALLPGATDANITITFKDYDPRTKTYVSKQESFLLPIQVIAPPAPQDEQMDMRLVATYAIIGVLILLLLLAIILLVRRPKQPAAAQSPQPASPQTQPAPPAK